MIGRYTGGIVPESQDDTPLDQEGASRIRAYRDVMDRHELHLGAQETWSLISRANQYVEESAPWNLAKAKETERLASVLGALVRALARVTLMIQPFIPAKAEVVWQAMGQTGSANATHWGTMEVPNTAGSHVTRLTPLFPKPEAGHTTD
jgi:methionyl-tRNA synthetase